MRLTARHRGVALSIDPLGGRDAGYHPALAATTPWRRRHCAPAAAFRGWRLSAACPC